MPLGDGLCELSNYAKTIIMPNAMQSLIRCFHFNIQ